MIDLDAIEKECQQMIADGLGFIAPKSCGNADMVAELVAELRSNLAGKPINRRVMKTGGSFQHSGVVVSEFKTTLGQDRVVVEFDAPVAGMLHIYRPDQVDDTCKQCEQ